MYDTTKTKNGWVEAFVYLKNKSMRVLLIISASILFFSCKSKQKETGDWIKGNKEEQLKTIEKHLRGLDMAMVEIDYRYRELFWAGKDQNWDYATYQVDKIKLSLENAIQRRPQRAKSAEHFLQTILPEMKRSVESRDTIVFNKSIEILTLNCNSCHAAEKVPQFNIQPPEHRFSSIKKQ